MNKLSDIPKKEIFEVPEGYFERLPQVIQARTAGAPDRSIPQLTNVLRYALPFVLIIASLWFWFRSPGQPSVERMLADIDTEELVSYLMDTDIELDDILTADLESVAADEIEAEVFGIFTEDEIQEDDVINEF